MADDCCVVCATPLEWVAVGACGHRETCASCSLRLRLVLDDASCVLCKQELPHVLVTRAAGQYTAGPGPGGWAGLPDRRDVREFHRPGGKARGAAAGTGMFFDDDQPMRALAALAALRCPEPGCAGSGAGGADGAFGSLKELKAHVSRAHKKAYCEICLEGRKAFVSEQTLYSAAELARHVAGTSDADAGSDLAASGFKGHPQCRFCKKRFYGESELFTHMQRDHFTCHICRRQRPDEYVYYRDYNELEQHFRQGHALCEHPSCLARKFVVFSSAAELRAHEAFEHGDQMSRAQRKAGMRLEVNFSVAGSAGDREQQRRETAAERRERERAERARAEEAALRDAARAEMEERARREAPAPEVPAAPAQAPAGPGAFAPVPRYAAAAGVGGAVALHMGAEPPRRTAEEFPSLPGGGGGAAPEPARPAPQQSAEEQFPGLPVTTKAQKKRNQKKSQSLQDLFTGQQAGSGWAAGRPSVTGDAAPAVLVSGAPATAPPPRWASGGRHPAGASAPRPPPPPAPAPPAGSEPAWNVVQARGGGGGRGAQAAPAPAPQPRQQQPAAVTDEVRAKNRALLDRARQLTGTEDRFSRFKQLSGEFRVGAVNAEGYLDEMGRLGLSELVAELAALLPDVDKRQALEGALARRDAQTDRGAVAHARNVMFPGLEDPFGGAPARGARPAPPAPRPAPAPAPEEPAAPQWACEACSLLNGASSLRCGACGSLRAFDGSAPAGGGKGKKGKKGKGVRLTLGDIHGGGPNPEADEHGGVDPYNAWTHSRGAGASRDLQQTWARQQQRT